jgi:hypothetical protein
VTLGLSVACAGGAPAVRPAPRLAAPLDDVLPAPSTIRGDFAWRQRLVASYGEEDFSFQAMLEKSGGTLSLLFLTPYGSRALLLQQTDSRLETRYFVSQRLPFPARYILTDVYRVYFRGMPEAPLADGVHRMNVDGETFVDRWQGGALLQREVYAATSKEPAVLIRYQPGASREAPADRVELDNRAYGYRIAIDTVPLR